MKISKLLNKVYIILFLFCLLTEISFSNEPIDIWKIEKIDKSNKITKESSENSNLEIIQGVKIEKQNENIIINEELESSEVKLAGLYDPSENGLTMDMWENSNGVEIKNLLKKLNSENLSNFSEKILDVTLLTNSYFPSSNIATQEFIDFKFEYLIKKKDFDLIKRFLIKNPSLKNNHRLVRYYADHYLSNSPHFCIVTQKNIKMLLPLNNTTYNVTSPYLKIIVLTILNVFKGDDNAF